jgi:plastocyanin
MFITLSLGAKEVKIVQAGKAFLEDIDDKTASEVIDSEELENKYKIKTLELKVGDKLNFANRDRVSHNVRALNSNDDEIFDVKLQRPGSDNDKSIEITESGEFNVKCRIHPKMNLKVKVSPN